MNIPELVNYIDEEQPLKTINLNGEYKRSDIIDYIKSMYKDDDTGAMVLSHEDFNNFMSLRDFF